MVCDTPLYVQRSKASLDKVPVPCGRCPPCKQRRVNSWVFRLMKEYERSTDAHFVTITYDTDHVPITKNGFMTLDKSDVQKYFKRLRKLMPGITFKYYLAGEYGTQNKRPHYHFIAFNCPNEQFYFDAWGNGTVHVGKVTDNSVAYTMKYIDKHQFRPMHGRDDRLPEFSLMSKGLGDNYLTDDVKQYHKSDISVMYLTKPGGYRIAMPRYYRNKIFTDLEKSMQVDIVNKKFQEITEKKREEVWQLYGDYFTFEAYKDNERFGRYQNFYSQQKNRNL